MASSVELDDTVQTELNNNKPEKSIPKDNPTSIVANVSEVNANISYGEESPHTCVVCSKSYQQAQNLKYHIRELHFNLIGRIPFEHKRRVNEVWFERVGNTDAIIQIKKTGLNKYLMNKAIGDDAIKVSNETKSLDLSLIYPTCTLNTRLWCHQCNKTYSRRSFRVHISSKHRGLKVHKCINCNAIYERLCEYIKHECNGDTAFKVQTEML